MKKATILALILIASFTGYSQISVSESVLSYPVTDYKNVSDLKVTITNGYTTDEDVVLRSYNSDFYVDDSTLTIKAGTNQDVMIHFKPVHNISYNSELVVISQTKTGSLSIDLKGDGKYSTYYASTFNLFEQDLKDELKTVVSKGYKNLGYNGARDAMYGSIDNKSGKVECVYTGRVATFNSRSGANSNSFNCEHTWPQSLFNKNEPERADIHHLFPTDVNANGRRSNYAFGLVSNPSWSEGGSKLSGNTFEPRDAQKGDCARAMMYFAIRYQNYASFLTNQEALLRNWSKTHPPTQTSIDRNNAIHNYQKNRNPFVDYPEYLDRITSISSASAAANVAQVTPSVSAINITNLATAGSFVYQLVLTNTGNQTVLFTGFSNGNTNVTYPKTAFELSPGESRAFKITIKPTGKVISDAIKFSSSNVTLTVPLSITGLSSVTDFDNNGFAVYVNDHVLQIRNANQHHVSVIDINGQVVYFNEIQSDLTEIQVSDLASGVYFVQAIGKGLSPQVIKILIP